MPRSFQKTLYVGLGGTGAEIGAKFEQRLRAELCGPDGRNLLRGDHRDAYPGFEPYQLPDFVKFVYADFDQSTLNWLTEAPAVSERVLHKSAVYLRNLSPPVESYPEVARRLRAGSPEYVSDWLPPSDNEPPVTPLRDGAGQFPTVGRAALAEACRSQGLNSTLLNQIRDVVRALARSNGQLYAVCGGASANVPNGVDVFVGFSVAGGTGCGIFYDFIHILGDMFRQDFASVKVSIYPLVVLPSAFKENLGGGRRAQLNGAHALVDLARLVDSQNQDLDRTRKGVVLPDMAEGRAFDLSLGMTQTAFLFHRPAAFDQDDLHRSIVSFVESLVGAPAPEESEGEQRLSFAQQFVNNITSRNSPSRTGIGLRPATMALSASLTVPVHEIATILADKLVAEAVAELEVPAPGELNGDMRREFIFASGLGPLHLLEREDPPSPESASGAEDVIDSLTDRREQMLLQVGRLRVKLESELPAIVDYQYTAAIRSALAKGDPFRLRRVIFGSPGLERKGDQRGFLAWVEDRAVVNDPRFAAAAQGQHLPAVPDLRDKLFRKTNLARPEVRAHLGEQDSYYDAACEYQYRARWATLRTHWERSSDRLRNTLGQFVAPFRSHVADFGDRYARACAQLYGESVAVTYFMPPGGADNNLDLFYGTVLQSLARSRDIPEDSSRSKILLSLLGAEAWRDAFAAELDATAGSGLEAILERTRTELEIHLAKDGPNGSPPLLPGEKALLRMAAAAGDDASEPIRRQLQRTLVGLLPPGFDLNGLQGDRCVVTYPADDRDPQVEQFLRSSLQVPGVDPSAIEMLPTSLQSLTVSISHSALGILEVPEVKQLLRRWDEALARPRPADKLPWRQRTGYDFDYMFADREARKRLVASLMVGLWDGLVTIAEDPAHVTKLELHHPKTSISIALDLPPTGRGISRWANFIQAYERLILDASKAEIETCAAFIAHAPGGVYGEELSEPSDLVLPFLQVVERDIRAAEQLADGTVPGPEPARAMARAVLELWTETLPDAIDHPFSEGKLRYATLRELGDAASSFTWPDFTRPKG